ncbi:MAG: TolC family protein, partial [Rhodanobacteraceae bacterium]
MIPASTPRHFSLRHTRGVAIAGCLALAACAAGPNFKPPAPPKVSGYMENAPANPVATPGVAGGSAQTFQQGADIPGDWWELFHSKALDALVSEALENNHDLKAAQAALKVAHEDVLAQRGSFSPAVSAGFSASRERDPSAALAPVPSNNAYQYSLFTPQLTISYAPDLFGLNRRARESLEAQEQAARFQMIAAWTTLTSNVVVTAVEEASLRDQADATRQLIDLEKKSLGILRLRFDKGDASKLDVAAQQSQLAQT